MKIPLWVKFAMGVSLLGLGLAATNYVAGFAFVIINKTNPLDVYATWWEWKGGYRGDEVQKGRLKVALLIGLGVCFALPAIITERILRKSRSLHGDARWATTTEVRQAGLFGNTGIIVGKLAGQFLMLGGQLFALLAAPTRSGKGVGVVIPNLLNFSDSVVVLDLKQENFKITSKFRAIYGHEVHLFNPFAEDGRTSRWNPLSYINPDPLLRISDITAIGYALFPNSTDGKDSFFNDQARNLFLGLVLYLLETPELPCTIGEALRISSGKGSGKDLHVYLTDLMAARDETERPLSDDCVMALQRFTANSDNTRASILASFNAPLINWANPIVDAATSANDFLLSDVRKKRMSIYLGVSPNKLSQSSLIMNLFFTQLINENVKQLPQDNPELKYQCLLIMDEFTALGKVEIINSAVSFMAGYNLRLLPIIQSVSQLASKYGEHDARTLTTNHALQILYPPREQKDANEYSEMLGYFGMESTSNSISNKGMFPGLPGQGAPSRGESTSDQRRALMLPQELREMPQTEAIVTLENTRPIRCEKVRYYDDPVFVDRLKEASPSLAALGKKIPTREQLQAAIGADELCVPVRKLNMESHIARVETRQRPMNESDLHTGGDGSAPGFDFESLAHDFSDLPSVTDPESPSPDEIKSLVDDFFTRLSSDEPESPSPGEGLEVETDEPAVVGIDLDAVLIQNKKAEPTALDLSELADDDGVLDDSAMATVHAAETASSGRATIATATRVNEKKPTNAKTAGKKGGPGGKQQETNLLDMSILDSGLEP